VWGGDQSIVCGISRENCHTKLRTDFKSLSGPWIRKFRISMRRQDLRDQAEQANYEAVQGGIDGGIRWFLGGVIVFGTAQLVWPFYRGLTIPFKVGPRKKPS